MTKRRIKRIRIARNKAIRAVAQSGIPTEIEGGRTVIVQAKRPRALNWRITFFHMERANGLHL